MPSSALLVTQCKEVTLLIWPIGLQFVYCVGDKLKFGSAQVIKLYESLIWTALINCNKWDTILKLINNCTFHMLHLFQLHKETNNSVFCIKIIALSLSLFYISCLFFQVFLIVILFILMFSAVGVHLLEDDYHKSGNANCTDSNDTTYTGWVFNWI